MNNPTFYELIGGLVSPSPLDALRKLELDTEQLTKLAIGCEYLGHRDFADLVMAEAQMRAMLAERGRRCLS